MSEAPQDLADVEITFDSDDPSSVFSHLPRVSKETMSDVKNVLEDCQDGEALKYYMPIFMDRFTTNEEKEDLDQLISILRNISRLSLNSQTTPSFTDAQRRQAECLLAKFLLDRWGRTHDTGDVDESLHVSRRLLRDGAEADPHFENIKQLLSEATEAQASELYTVGKNAHKAAVAEAEEEILILENSDSLPSVSSQLPAGWIPPAPISDEIPLFRTDNMEFFLIDMPESVENFVEEDDGDHYPSRLISVLRNITLLPLGPVASFSTTQRTQSRRLLAKLLLDRWIRTHDADDVDECVFVLRQLHESNPLDKDVEKELLVAIQAQCSQKNSKIEEGLHNDHRRKGKRLHTEHATGPMKKRHLSDHAIPGRATDNSDTLKNHPEISDFQILSEKKSRGSKDVDDNQILAINLNYLSKETIFDANHIIGEIRDTKILHYIMQELLVPLTKKERESKEDLNQLICPFSNPLKTTQPSDRTMFSDAQLKEIQRLHAKSFIIRWGRMHGASETEESVRITPELLKKNPLDKSVETFLFEVFKVQGYDISCHGGPTPNVETMVPQENAPLSLISNIMNDLISLDKPTSREHMFLHTWGDTWTVRFFEFPGSAENLKKSRLSKHFVQMFNNDILSQGQVPQVSDDNIAEIANIERCQDFLVLARYMCIFEDRFQKSWHIADLECQIAALQGILCMSHVNSDEEFTRNLQRDIVMVLFHPAVLKQIGNGALKSLELLIDFAHKANSRKPSDRQVREALFNGLASQAFYEDQMHKHLGDEKPNRVADQYFKNLEKALTYVQHARDHARKTLASLMLLKWRILVARSQMGALESEAQRSQLLDWAKPICEYVWGKKDLIMHKGNGLQNVAVEQDMLTVLYLLYDLSPGVEYLHRIAEVKAIGDARFDPDVKFAGPDPNEKLFTKFKKDLLRKRFQDTFNVADLRLLLQLSNEEFSTKYKDGHGEIDYSLLSDILQHYSSMYEFTGSVDAAEELQRYAHLALHNPLPREDPLYVKIRESSVLALIHHFLSNRIRNVDSLREAASTLLNMEGSTVQYLRLLGYLGKGHSSLFRINWHLPTVEFAIRHLRSVVELCLQIQDPRDVPCIQELLDLACALFLRDDFMKSVAGSIAASNPSISHLTGALALQSNHSSDVYLTDRQEPHWQWTVLESDIMNEGGSQLNMEPEWSHFMDLAFKKLVALRERDPRQRSLGLHTQVKLIIRRAQFSGECLDLETRKKHIDAFKDAVGIIQSFFVEKGRTFRSQRGIVDDKNITLRTVLSVPFHTAHFALCWGEVKSAVELLDHGRSIIWSRMRRLRIMDSQLEGVSDDLRTRFFQTCAEIERTITLEPLSDPEGLLKSFDIPEKVDHPSHVHLRREALERKLSSIVEEIREFPGFTDFLEMPPFEKLQRAADKGPVIIVTMAGRELTLQTYKPKPLVGHAIIVLPSSDPVVVTLDTKNFEDRVIEVNKSLVRIRGNPGSASSNSELRNALKEIGELIVKDVVAKLIRLGVKNQSRIWWCLTTVFSSFPVHAAMWRCEAGSEKSRLKCLNELYISSYTPSLVALIQARLPPPLSKVAQNSGTSMLVIKQQDARLATADKEVKNIMSAASNAIHDFGRSFRLYGGEAPDEHEHAGILADLPNYKWIHLACHGKLDATDPFSSHFKIGKDGVGRITLMDILKSRVPNAELAFLSACHTARLPDQVSREESLHLAAAMQFCGYRSVVGTLWPMKDEDAPEVAKAFYEYMFAEPKDEEEVGYLRSAHALNKLTEQMRRCRKYMNCPERWVNFVHIGA